jgi:hypothetical protein
LACAAPLQEEPAPGNRTAADSVRGVLWAAGQPEVSTVDLATWVRPDLLDADPAAALDTMAALARLENWQVGEETPLPELRRSVLDVEAQVGGGGSAGLSFQLERLEDDTWRVVSILGPEIEWPSRPRRRDEGLSSSSPPRLP